MSARKVRADSESEAETFQARAPRPRSRSGKAGDAFGEEGSNKTVAQPKPEGEPSEETVNLERSRFIPRTPYTRG